MAKARGHSWQFKTRFRRHAFGWKSQPAIARLHEAVSEIALVARSLLDEAATLFLNGEPEAARLLLRDLVNATVGF